MAVNEDILLELSKCSQLLGGDLTLVQGPGGNISGKDNKLIYIKASGFNMRESLNMNIFAEVPLKVIEGEYEVDSVNSRTSELRPSIELFFHLFIKSNFVIHIHSIGAIAASIRSDAKEVITLLNRHDLAFVPYARPGKELANMLRIYVDQAKHSMAILQNHGLLVWGENLGETYKNLLEFEQLLREVKITGLNRNSRSVYDQLLDGEINIGYLTPDHCVFSKEGLSKSLEKYQSDKFSIQSKQISEDPAGEIEWSLIEVLKLIPQGRTINQLTVDQQVEVTSGEDEIFRHAKNSI